MTKSRNFQLGILYACSVFAFLAICYLLDVARPEWGLATSVVLFGPSHEQTTKRALARLAATAAAGASLLILDAIASSNEAAFILAAAFPVGAASATFRFGFSLNNPTSAVDTL